MSQILLFKYGKYVKSHEILANVTEIKFWKHFCPPPPHPRN